jgi:hypothetical protein
MSQYFRVERLRVFFIGLQPRKGGKYQAKNAMLTSICYEQYIVSRGTQSVKHNAPICV